MLELKHEKTGMTFRGPQTGSLDDDYRYEVLIWRMQRNTRMQRELDYLEKYYYWRTVLGHYTSYRVVAEYDEKLSIEEVYSAVTNMMKGQSHLAVDIVSDNNNNFGHSIVLLDSVKLGDVVEFVDDESLNDVSKLLNKYHSEIFKFGEKKPLWRLKIVNGKYAVFFCDHILFDGTSGKNFHIEFSKGLKLSVPEVLVDLDSEVFNKSSIDLSTYFFAPSPTLLLKADGPLSYIIYTLFTRLAPKCISNWIRDWFEGNPYAKQLQYETISYKQLQLFPNEENISTVLNIDPTKTSALLKLSREHGVKLTSLLVILFHLSIVKVIPKESKDTVTSIPVNMRPYLKEAEIQKLGPTFTSLYGLYVGAVNINLPSIDKICLEGKVNWDVVRYVNDEIHQNVEKGSFIIGLLRFVNGKQFTIDKHEKQEKLSLEISNLGMIPPSSDNILDAWFDQPGEVFSANVISTATNGANLVLRCVNNSYLDKFKAGIEEEIEKLLVQEI